METVLIISSVLLWVVVLFTLLVTLALVRRLNRQARGGTPNSIPHLEKGEKAPEFSAQTLSGETVTLATYAGRKVAFLFVSAHCTPCRELLPKVVPSAPAAAEADVDLVLVSSSDAEQTRALAEEFHISSPVLLTPPKEGSFMSDYKINGTPSYVFFDEQGIVQSAGHPSMEWGEWKDLVDSWTQQRALISPKKGK